MADTDQPRVTPATSADIDVVTDQWVALARDQRRHGSTLLAAENRGAVREWVARSVVTGELLVARDDDEVIGFVGFALDRGEYGREHVRGTVSNLFVRPERRGEGVGAELLTAAEDALADAGAEAVALEALVDNDRARSFYADQGYDPHRIELRKPLRNGDESEGTGSER